MLLVLGHPHSSYDIIQGRGKVGDIALVKARYRYPGCIGYVDVIFLYEIGQLRKIREVQTCENLGRVTFKKHNLRWTYPGIAKHAGLIDEMRSVARRLKMCQLFEEPVAHRLNAAGHSDEMLSPLLCDSGGA